MIVCLEPETELRTPYVLTGREFSVSSEASEPVEHKFFAGDATQSFGGGWGMAGKFESAAVLPRGQSLVHVIVNHTDHHVAVSFRIYDGWGIFYQKHGLFRYGYTGCLPLLLAALALLLFFL